MDGHAAAPGPGDVGYALARDTFVNKAESRVWGELLELGTRLHFGRNDMLIVAGTPSDHVLLIEHGLVKVLLPGEGRDLVVGFYGPGELMGEQGVLFSEARSATVVAHTPGTATRVPGRLFRRYVERNPAVLGALYGILRERLRKADQRQQSLVGQDVPTRVARQLLAWSETLGTRTADGVTISGLSRKDLAQCIGAGETTVDAVLKDLTSLGLVRTHWRKYVLPSPRRLLDHITNQVK
ncbi:cAMP-binding domain of CRP or a regulatory subunit of cAMP-dependent protein kinases [Saccharopolyspora antimicrobica]|uniref:CRP-like cAMP-binding protein n=1 Tax=Saccharopolyspora antimicrobica TaxID=455193 RepID=A0A1I4QKL8_9PSEU|nr:CRP-like cAMP-binding protein [Saccharopolyspora antimicrobica]SFM40607.1 cAMP-binding domain of CRP or a regulatory subunit of cAMP-dependent protein kinases [Saccharopolyspora antimicrobica]